MILLDGVGDGLLGKAILQLEGGNRQAVDEEGEVEGELRLVAAVSELAGDAEAVLGVPLRRDRVAWRWGAVEEVELVGSVLHAVAEHVDHAALADLALQAVEELAPRRTVLVEVQSVGSVDLRRPQEGAELGEINRRLAE